MSEYHYHPTVVSYCPYYGYQNWYYILEPELLELQYIGRNEVRDNLLDWQVLGTMYLLEVLGGGSYRLLGLQDPRITTDPKPLFRTEENIYHPFWHEETQGGTPVEIPDEIKEQLILGALKAVEEGKLKGLSEESIDELQREATYLRRKPLIMLRAYTKRNNARMKKLQKNGGNSGNSANKKRKTRRRNNHTKKRIL